MRQHVWARPELVWPLLDSIGKNIHSYCRLRLLIPPYLFYISARLDLTFSASQVVGSQPGKHRQLLGSKTLAADIGQLILVHPLTTNIPPWPNPPVWPGASDYLPGPISPAVLVRDTTIVTCANRLVSYLETYTHSHHYNLN